MEQHAQIHHDGRVVEFAVAGEVVVGDLQGAYGVALFETGVGIVFVVLVDVVDMPCRCVVDALVAAVVVHPYGIGFQIVGHVACDVAFGLVGQMTLGHLDYDLMSQTSPCAGLLLAEYAEGCR